MMYIDILTNSVNYSYNRNLFFFSYCNVFSYFSKSYRTICHNFKLPATYTNLAIFPFKYLKTRRITFHLKAISKLKVRLLMRVGLRKYSNMI